jgi:hypothetical protein
MSKPRTKSIPNAKKRKEMQQGKQKLFYSKSIAMGYKIELGQVLLKMKLGLKMVPPG